jgi:hypothetical protein
MSNEENIYVALARAQTEFGTVAKGSVNPAFKSRYADLADVAGAVIPVLARHGVAVLHYPVRSLGGALDMRTEFVHGATGTAVQCDVPLIVTKNDMQGFKSATTYAKRIGLESLSGVAPEDDDGNAAVAAAPPATITADQAATLVDLAEDVSANWPAFIKYLGVQSIEKLPASRYADAVAMLEKKRKVVADGTA